ncbi:hypothetical protein F4779DRAFT_630341 [Xylariaceae sp. FL0662B]|nr:hypothetical protein F4779DRAFT_630341 [Xylariaceae sp. FL0662B]
MLSNRRSTMLTPANVQAPAYRPGALPAIGSLRPENEPRSASPSVLTSTTASLPGYRTVRVLGAVYGATAYAHKDANARALLKATGAGAEAKAVTHMLYNARDRAVERLTRDAVARGANAVVALTFGESEVLGFAQVSVYGTAVFVEREAGADGLLSP